MEHISWQDFEQVELRAVTITRVEDFPEAHKPAYKIWAETIIPNDEKDWIQR